DLSDDQIKQALDLAQTRLNNELQAPQLESFYTKVYDGIGWVSMAPIDPPFQRLISISTSENYQALKPISYFEYQQRVSTDHESRVIELASAAYGDIPQYYTVNAQAIYLWPAATVGTAIEIRYYKMETLLSSDGPIVNSNVFTLNYPDLLIFATCVEASAFIAEDERSPMWEAKYQGRLVFYNDQNRRSRYGQGVTREIPTMGLVW